MAPSDPTKHGFIEFYEMKYKMMILLQTDVADQMGVPTEVKRELVYKGWFLEAIQGAR